MEVPLADDPGQGGADEVAEEDSGECECEGFEEEHAEELGLGAAEGLHESEVAAAFEDAGGEGGEDGDGDGEGDEENSSVHEGVSAVDDSGLAFD